MIVSAHEATQQWPCKRVDCDQLASQNRGKFAFLCDHHRDERRGDAPTPPAANARKGRSLGESARRLVPLATTLEKALQRRSAAKTDAHTALEALNEGLRELREVAQALITGSWLCPPR